MSIDVGALDGLEEDLAAADHDSIEGGPAFARGGRWVIEKLRARLVPAEDDPDTGHDYGHCRTIRQRARRLGHAMPECDCLVPAEDGPQLVKVPNLGDNPSYFVKATVPAEDEGLPAIGQDNPRSRWHQEETTTGRKSWACVPLTDAIQARHPAEDEGRLREAAQKLRAAAVKAGAHIVVTNDYPDGVKAFGVLCDAIDVMDAALAATPEPR